MVDNMDDVIDSRDVIERLTELQDAKHDGGEPLTDDEETELASLIALAEQGVSFDDWQYGATLIRDSHFRDYAMELAEDIGAVPSEYTWPISCIDWDQATRELRMDYSSVEFDGITYWIR